MADIGTYTRGHGKKFSGHFHGRGAPVCMQSHITNGLSGNIYPALANANNNYSRGRGQRGRQNKVLSGRVKSVASETATSKLNTDSQLEKAVSSGTDDDVQKLIDTSEDTGCLFSQKALDSGLIEAVNRGKKFMVQLLVNSGADPTNKGEDGNSALLIAAQNGFLDITRLLLKKGANVNDQNSNSDTPLHLCINPSGAADLIHLLLLFRAQVDLQNNEGYTPLMKAIEVKDIEAMKILIDSGSDVDQVTNKQNETAVTIARRQGLVCVIHKLKSEACSIGKKRIRPSALAQAVSDGDLKTTKLLVDYYNIGTYKNANNGNILIDNVKSLCTKVHSAQAARRKLEIMKVLLKNGADINAQEHSDGTALMVASKHNCVEVVRLLCGLGARLNILVNNQTALILAARQGHLDTVKVLLDFKANMNIKTDLGEDAFFIALQVGQVECAKLLKTRGATVDLVSAARCVVEKGVCQSLKFLDMHCNIDVNKGYLLHLAVKNGHDSMISLLLEMGANVNAVNVEGSTPLTIALQSVQRESLVKELVKHGADVNDYRSIDGIPLHLAISGSLEMTRILLEAGAEVDKANTQLQETALMLACKVTLQLKIVELLLSKGASQNLQNTKGETALHLAIVQQNVGNVKLLVEHGADLEVRNKLNETAYLLAADTQDLELIELLQKHGADVSVLDVSGCNALMRAIKSLKSICSVAVVSSIVGKAQDQVHHRCENGVTPLMLAALGGNVEVLRAMLKFGADVHIVNREPLKEVTALSILLEKWPMYGKQDEACIEELIRHGAVNSLPKRCSKVLHEVIAMDRRKIVQLMLTNGMSASMSEFQPVLRRLGPFLPSHLEQLITKKSSPLMVALVLGKVQVARYLAGNLVLCPSDLTGEYSWLRDYLVSINMMESVSFLDSFHSQPPSLLQLSLTAVSHAVGSVPGRQERVDKLPLPTLLKDTLLLRKEDVPMDLTGVRDLPDDLYGFHVEDDDFDNDSGDDDSIAWFVYTDDDDDDFLYSDNSVDCLYFGAVGGDI